MPRVGLWHVSMQRPLVGRKRRPLFGGPLVDVKAAMAEIGAVIDDPDECDRRAARHELLRDFVGDVGSE